MNRAISLQLVIPTLWKPTTLVATLEHYLAASVVERVVLIDNAPNLRPAGIEELRQHKKLELLAQSENLFVNRAWNVGMAKIGDQEALVGILNDDILIPDGVLMLLLDQAPAPGVVVGLLPPGETNTSFALVPFPYRPDYSIGQQCQGFGSALFLRRGDFTPIPPELKIWFGDDWILRQAKQVLGLRSALISMDRHVTMGAMRASPDFRQLLASDKRHAGKLLGLHGC